MVSLRVEERPTDLVMNSFEKVDRQPSNGLQPQDRDKDLYCSSEVHILILDDDPSVARIMQTALSHKDFMIDVMAEPAQMETQLQLRPYHIVILDYIIPGLESEKVLGWVREYQPTASIIVVTGYPTIDSALNCLRAGTFDYLTKPFQMSQLQHVVMRCLENKGLLRLSEEALRESLGAPSGRNGKCSASLWRKWPSERTSALATSRKSSWARTRPLSKRSTASRSAWV